MMTRVGHSHPPRWPLGLEREASYVWTVTGGFREEEVEAGWLPQFTKASFFLYPQPRTFFHCFERERERERERH